MTNKTYPSNATEIEIEGRRYVAFDEEDGCIGCAFARDDSKGLICNKPSEMLGAHCAYARGDGRNVIWKEVPTPVATEETVGTSSEAPSFEPDPFTNGPKPTLGLSPRSFWLDDRKSQILLACNRYADAGKDIPFDWIKQLQEVERLLRDGE